MKIYIIGIFLSKMIKLSFQEKNKKIHKTKGFVLLYAVLLSSVILTIGLAILDIVILQQNLAGTQRDSALAFYSADTALECVLYWDYKQNDFDKSPGNNGKNVSCDGVQASLVSESADPGKNSPWVYVMRVDFLDGRCANVAVTKTWGPGNTLLRTEIESRGYNTSCPSAGTVPRRLERGVRITY